MAFIRNPPQHFIPAWLPRMRERNERVWRHRLQEMQMQAESDALRRQLDFARKPPAVIFR
jgi:hypothetical protein